MLTASVIIPNLHSPHLGAVLTALSQQTTPPLEVIVVGQDRYGFHVAHPAVRMLTTPHPVPPAVARNLGLAHARGDVCCFLDADCIPQAPWLERLLARQMEGDAVVVGAVALGNERFWQRCDNIAAMAPFLVTAPRGPRLYVISANLAIRRALLLQQCGFDLSFRYASGEDSDLAFRLVLQGHTPQFEPTAIIHHETSRDQAAKVWRHIWLYGTQWPMLVDRYPQILGLPFWRRSYRTHPLLAWLLIPFWTLKDVYKLYSAQPALLRHHWPTLWGVYWVRIAWYVGQIVAFRKHP
ncbi:glycosyltransferase family 2 protein [Candidatus Viridilinea mediisalina]|uniref:Glycosyltransferase 2-like domain-containing protein n=1 Tax=Candidatus Viridilinea mediisalina TaxID=2024553 RepID=A0A2A6RLD8_9CHLR|nr:glycosyltransferase [Candidatus Viridilinea mediisalina]PDW03887.1 hypothetical protein CJ255_06445 [Candidatus Viridilinea mediisalina]